MKIEVKIGRSAKSLWVYLCEGVGFVISDEGELNKKYASKMRRYYVSIFWGGRKRLSFTFGGKYA